MKRTKVAFEDKLVKIALWGSSIPCLLCTYLIAQSDMSIYLKILLILIILVLVAYSAFAIRQQVIFQLRTSTNLVEAMTSGDYSLRANNKEIEGALSDFNDLLNNLASKLAQQSLITREKQILLTKVIMQIDVAVIASDEHDNISLMNPSAERLFSKRFDSIQGWPIKTLGLQKVIKEAVNKVTEFEIDKTKRKVFVRTDKYFELSQPHHLIFITDIQQILREEERLAWQRLLRVLSHEINNSLTPIASISETLSTIVNKRIDPANSNSSIQDDKTHFTPYDFENLQEGLSVITERAHSLNHFIQDYQKLTRLPAPNKSNVQLKDFVYSIVQLFQESVFHCPKENYEVFADREQLQQVLVNLVKNAQEANLSNPANTKSEIHIEFDRKDGFVEIMITDHGKGLSNEDNLFVPFYTTKKHGSGIGLSLSRQIALNHRGDLHLHNVKKQEDGSGGARAVLRLPSGI